MITFQPALDPLHSLFRMIRILDVTSTCREPEIEKVRILDFYIAFPFRAKDIKFHRGHGGFRKLATAYEHLRPYGGLPDDRDLLIRMMPAQLAAIDTLASHGFISTSALKKGLVMPGDTPFPSSLHARAAELNEEQSDLSALVDTLCREYPLLGPDGLKQRTGLMEYRYDVL